MIMRSARVGKAAGCAMANRVAPSAASAPPARRMRRRFIERAPIVKVYAPTACACGDSAGAAVLAAAVPAPCPARRPNSAPDTRPVPLG